MVRPSLNDLAAFAAVASHRSFRRAAEVMGVSRSALSHAIIGLEGKLGVRLFNRTTRSVSLTQAGARLLARLDPVLQDLDQALDTLSEERGTPSGTLRINANKSGARILLAEVVPLFLDLYPDVELDLVSEGRLVDIVEQGFDAGVRLLEAIPRDMIGVKFGGDVRFIAVAAPSYLDGRAIPNTPDDLHAHCCIRQRLPSGKRYRWEFSKRSAEVAVDVPGNLTLDDNDLLVQAAADGRGIAYIPEHFAQPFLESGQLVTVLDDWCPPIPGLALYYPRSRHVPSPLRAFIDLLREVDKTR
ncbi:LysR family transcriptional regulator [Rhizobium laguerreae]|jgi:DNA-binding transcriptional LysR family regulator|uniref:HTH-type transcriptional regulator TtuA n=1 Tax=Rhizobium laguerreae TaxID=1076926 RepID=A0A1S9GZA3_9HYPH|nr:LysR family transcriptional regulator [Rhizobium laguerreae]MBB3163826.1 DNA-binding transcriptional LysR family regulator [Rhizobium laguerreae]MBY3068252.1 LysR family transcriptional regulator [Rhizobium laguerreae]MBY3075491.1 LysR family transcriptional regulator [Rhizobium laguerreae]MBY3082046.1 LysR family transcriptional regulator [Rhizobium laguerreae]MBY3109041.1 LysR family transcriptional regulator [Rhizobium laguerreae]